MANTPLPATFAWQPHFDGQALILRDRAIATLFPLSNGHVRCTRKLHTRHMTHSFHDDTAQAERFVEAWARRWEREIVDLYDGLAPSTYQAAFATEPRMDVAVYVPKRKARRRKT